MHIEKLKIFNRKLINTIASLHLRVFKDRVQVKGLDKDGNPFRDYSEDYAEKKRSGEIRGEKGLGGRPLNSQVKPVNLTLTGEMMKAIHHKDEKKDGYTLAWRTKDTNDRVLANKYQGRDIIGAPKNDLKKVADEIERQFQIDINKTIKDVTVRVG